jgi:hypothetical protein
LFILNYDADIRHIVCFAECALKNVVHNQHALTIC